MSRLMFTYNKNYYNERSAEVVVPLLLKLLNPKSVLDIGCGLGTWLNVFSSNGISDVLGIDGDHITKDTFNNDMLNFQALDISKPFQLSKKYDLALCLEVGEHLPEKAAVTFVENIVNHSDVVIFSAAIPGQGGNNHINEQWPTYWRKIFARFNYECFDEVRPLIWNNDKVDLWYKQNIMLYIRTSNPLASTFRIAPDYIDFVHPQLYAFHEYQSKRSVLISQGKTGWKIAFQVFWNTCKNKFLALKP